MAHLELRIKVDETGGMPELKGREPVHVQTMTVTSLERGTVGGAPTVALVVDLPDGKYLFAETTLALFLSAADALKAAHGDPRHAAPQRAPGTGN